MKWSELNYNDFYIPFDENQRAIRGFWLTTQGIDLENLPIIFKEYFKYFERLDSIDYENKKVYLNDIIGTSYRDYGDTEIIKAYMKIKRAKNYITDGMVTKLKYSRMLRKDIVEQETPIILAENPDGTYFVDGNGNHRIIFYKMMMLSEIALQYPYAYEQNFNFNRELFKDIKKKYWLNAKVKKYKK